NTNLNSYESVVLENKRLKKENRRILLTILIGILIFLTPLIYFSFIESEEKINKLINLDKLDPGTIGIPAVFFAVAVIVFIAVRSNRTKGSGYSLHQ